MQSKRNFPKGMEKMEEVQTKPKPRIMAIDDSELVLGMIENSLADEYTVLPFTQSPEAVLAMRELSPDLILLDYELPGLNGFQVVKWMQENTSLADIPVMFLTSYQDINFEVRAFELGAVDYIHKPFSPILLKSALRCIWSMPPTPHGWRAIILYCNPL